TDVTAAMVTAFKEDGRFAQNSKQADISRLHGFLKWAKTDIAKDEEQNEELWAVSAGKASHRRWLTRPQVNALLDVAKDRERLVIVLGAWQGLRAIEIARLHWRDVNMDAGSPTLTVLGKGQHGGKEATLAMNRLVWQELLPLSRGKKPSDPVYPAGYGRIDKDCRAVAKRAGIPFSAHDLRRAFGRIA